MSENKVAKTHPVLVLVERRWHPLKVISVVTGTSVALRLTKNTRKRLVDTTRHTFNKAESATTQNLLCPTVALLSPSYLVVTKNMTTALTPSIVPTTARTGAHRHTLLKVLVPLVVGIRPTIARTTSNVTGSRAVKCVRLGAPCPLGLTNKLVRNTTRTIVTSDNLLPTHRNREQLTLTKLKPTTKNQRETMGPSRTS